MNTKRNVALLSLVFTQLFPEVEEMMLQPLWESRDRYEELKQIDDAMKEVSSKYLFHKANDLVS